MKNIILIDLDETLLDFKADEKAALTKTLTTLGIEPSKDTLELYRPHKLGTMEAA